MSNFASKALESLKTPLVLKSFGWVLLFIALMIFAALFLPWQQTVTGEGSVTVFSPSERPQVISSLIDARILKWHVQEGDKVKRGDILLELEELNPSYLDADQLSRLAAQRQASIQKRRATESLLDTLERQNQTLSAVQKVVIPTAQQNLTTAELNYQRRKQLYEKGLISKRDLELAELDRVKADANTVTAGAEAALNIQDTESKIAQSYEKLAQINSEIYKMDIDLANLQSRIAHRKIYAPLDGQITRLHAIGTAQTVKAGEQIAVIVPESYDQAVEIFVPDYFASLVSVGRKVRLQFAGWPAFQFAGWPAARVGTFAGEVAVIDAYSQDSGRFRILVKPDHKRIKASKDEPWPDSNILRPGTKALGWVLLDEVPLWFEFWRILNGFPPTVMEQAYQKLPKRPKK